MARTRSSLWRDVVGNLAVLTVLTIVLNAVLLWRLAIGREAELRTDLADQFAQVLALRVEARIGPGALPAAGETAPWTEAFAGAHLPADPPIFAVATTTGFLPLATRGTWPPSLETDAARAQWLLDAVDLREAVAARRPAQGEWRTGAAFFLGRSYAVASTPVTAPGGLPVGAVRVAIPTGIGLLGPADRTGLPILLAFAVAASGVMGVFGFVLFRRRILSPIEALARGTDAVAEGAFQTRLGPGPANELGEVAEAFNKMAAALQRYRTENDGQLAELKAINVDLVKAREDLVFAEKMATVGRLAAGIAHELGNPLASVIGFAELLEGDADGSLAPDLLPRMRKELDRIHGIVGDLLAYSRRTPTAAVLLEPTGVAEVVETAFALVKAQPRFGEIGFVAHLPDDLPPVYAQPTKLQQVFLNLFVNAAEAMRHGGTVTVTAREDYENVQVEVRDEGAGLGADIVSSVFEPFFTTKDVGEGTGLGLSVSLQLVEAMGGTLIARRDSGPGACFILRLRRGPDGTEDETLRERVGKR